MKNQDKTIKALREKNKRLKTENKQLKQGVLRLLNSIKRKIS